jgi:hypothetical protein
MWFPDKLVIMANIVKSLRTHQKMIILGAALGVIALYIIPLDQIVNAVSSHQHQGIANAVEKIQAARDRIAANTHIPDDVQYKIIAHLGDVIDHLNSLGF